MNIDSVTLVYFSPTKGTRKVLQAIAKGFEAQKIEKIDLTRPQNRENGLAKIETDLLIVGIPVYEERVLDFLKPCLENLQGMGQPALAVAVYGNVGYGIVLKELQEIFEKQGFKTLGGGAFIARHSFSHTELPIAEKRPNRDDLKLAADFGHQAATKLGKLDSAEQMPEISLPGHLPFQSLVLPVGSAKLFVQVPEVNMDKCTECGACVKACPMAAINAENYAIDTSKCLRCFACVHSCPHEARQIDLKLSFIVKNFLKSAVEKPQQPVWFL